MCKKTYPLIVILSVLLLVSCGIIRPYKTPEMAKPDLFREVSTTDTSTIATLHYTEIFKDTILQKLIKEGIDQNPDLQIAYTRVQQAQAYYLQSGAYLLPTLNANANVTRSKFSTGQTLGRQNATQYQLGLSSNWEIDVWGKLRSNRRANLANFLQSEAGARAVQTSLISSIATFYYTLLSLDQQLAITKQTVINWDTTVQTMRALKEAATVTEAAVVQSQAQRYAAEVTIPDLKQQIRETENALSILLGNAPSAISRGSLQEQQTIAVLQTGIPSQLLSNRPDVQAAELNFRYAFELTNVARAYFYPSLVITGNAALSSFNLSTFFRSGSIAASIAAGLTQPILNQRTNRTRLDVAKAQQQEALINFQKTLLTAGQEVSNAISLYNTSQEKITIRSNEIEALQKSVDYSQELLRNGFANYTEVITARQSLLQAQLGQVNDHLQQLQAVVNLYRSLGGGWR
ncbi:MAG TPA: efflux transporter outer membrane subunit [Daejeonella sp.]|nr:efflux transporter outer membrane subunit [Daejeonella sp.]